MVIFCLFQVATFGVLVPSASAQSVTYKVIPIISPFNQVGANVSSDINQSGAAAFTDHKGGQQAFELKGNKSLPLTLLGGTCSSAVGINDSGQVVGGACPTGQSLMHAYLYSKGKTLDLGTLGGVSAEGRKVNQQDQIAGNYTLANGKSRAFFWQQNQWVDLGSLGGSYISAFGMNASGTITGQSDISNHPDKVYDIPRYPGFVWSAGTLTDLGPIFGSHFNTVYGINDAGIAVGSADLKGDMAAHAILWQNGTVQDLSPDGNISAAAIGINNLGQAVGVWGLVDTDPEDGPPAGTALCPCNAVLWQNGQEIFLGNLVPPEWDLLLAAAINDKGEIIAQAEQNGGQIVTVLLKPKPTKDAGDMRSLTPPTVRRSATGPRAFQRNSKGVFEAIW
jgi:probable HAF family extracellular repeat protein